METVESHLESHLDLLETLVRIPSHVTDPGGTDRVAEALLPDLVGMGFSVESIPQSPLPPEMRWIEAVMIPGLSQDQVGATHRVFRDGIGPESILLLGDLDTAFPYGESLAFPVSREGSRMFGPGVADMKGGLVTMIAALQALFDMEIPTPPIEVVLSGDEQAGSLGSRTVIETVAQKCAWALCVECARQGGKLMAERGHIGIGELVAEGHEAHAGSAYEQGVNAIDALARVIPPINSLSAPERGVLVTVTMIEGGRRRSVIPGEARATLDIRSSSRRDWDQTVQELLATVGEHGLGRVTARTYAHRPGVAWTADTDRLLAIISDVAEPIGVGIEALRSSAAGSSAFASGCVVMDGMGPIGTGLMTRRESIEIDSIGERAAILAGTILALGERGRQGGL
ncbi:MAG: M20/M25/M40 family metallo-hydrolase [Acidimicrobiia bacterium]